VKVADLIGRLKRVIELHRENCFSEPAIPINRKSCTALEELATIIEENPVNVRPAKKCKYPHFATVQTIEVPVKPPTWINRDGEEVIIESMTPAHLVNTIEFVRRVRTERGEAALGALEAEHARRLREQMAQAREFQRRVENEPPF
jgi:hypothetical protein